MISVLLNVVTVTDVIVVSTNTRSQVDQVLTRHN